MQLAMYHIAVLRADRGVEIDGVAVVTGEFAAGCGDAAEVRIRRVLLEEPHEAGFDDMHECPVGADHVLLGEQVPLFPRPALIHLLEQVDELLALVERGDGNEGGLLGEAAVEVDARLRDLGEEGAGRAGAPARSNLSAVPAAVARSLVRFRCRGWKSVSLNNPRDSTGPTKSSSFFLNFIFKEKGNRADRQTGARTT